MIPAARHLSLRQASMRASASHPRRLRPPGRSAPVRIEDNVWVGFDSVVMGGLTIGRGAIIGCKTVISEDIPPYAIVVGNPPRIVRFLDADDDEASRCAALEQFGLAVPAHAVRSSAA
jgi:acetyltransferase-like isoleucine patch superfamily enzyme